jgi:hypothetical protein
MQTVIRPDESSAMTAQPPKSEAAIFWRYVSSSLDRLVALALELDTDGFHWRPPAPETTSIAALAFHTLGNAEENILETLCSWPVNRDREGEFAAHGRTQDDLRERWATLRPRLEQALSGLDDEGLNAPCNHPRRGLLTGREVLIVVARHSAEHLGQAELTRDLWLASRPNEADHS